VVTRKKKSENVVKLEVKSADSLRDIIEFNSKILTEILHKLEVLNKKLNKAILLEKKLKNLQEEVSTFEHIYVQDHTSDEDDSDVGEQPDGSSTFWN